MPNITDTTASALTQTGKPNSPTSGFSQATKDRVANLIEIRVLSDPTDAELDRCADLVVEGIGWVPLLRILSGVSDSFRDRNSGTWQTIRGRLAARAKAGRILVSGPRCDLTDGGLEASLSQFSADDNELLLRETFDSERTQGIWGVADWAKPGIGAADHDKAVRSYDDLLTEDEVQLKQLVLKRLGEEIGSLCKSVELDPKDIDLLNILVVEESFRGLGLGKGLFSHVETGKGEGSRMMLFTQTEDNVRMYEQGMGAKCIGKRHIEVSNLSDMDKLKLDPKEWDQTWYAPTVPPRSN